MCSPMAFTIASTVFSAFSQYQQGKAQAKAGMVTAQNNRAIAEYNAKVQEQNAEIQRGAATDALQRGAGEAATIRQNARKANARARAISASKGLIADTGTNLDILEQNAATGELSALTAQNNAEREAYGFKVRATDYDAEAKNLRFTGDVGISNAAYQGKIAKQAGLLGAAGTLVTGTSDLAYKYPNFLGQNKLPWQKSGNVKPAWAGGGYY